MALHKSPSTTHPSCSVSSNRPVSSVEKLQMQPPKPSKIPSIIIKREMPDSVPNQDIQSASSNTNTQRTPCAAHTRPWRPSSVLPQHIQSETHLPNPKLAKLLDRGWKSASILPSYPLAGPKCNTPMTPTARRLPASAVQNTAKQTCITSKHPDSKTIRRNTVDDDSSDESESPRGHRRICCIPIPVFHTRSNVMTTARSNANTARQQASSTKCVPGITEISTRKSSGWSQAEQSRIPVARSTSPMHGNLNNCKPDYVHSRPVSAISAPIRGTSKIPVSCHTSGKPSGIASSYSSLNRKKPKDQDVPSQIFLAEKVVVNNNLNKNLKVPIAQDLSSPKSLAEKVVGDNSLQKTTKVQEVPSLKILPEKAVGNKNQQNNIKVPRSQGVPSLKFLAERAVGNNSPQKKTEVPRTQDVPSLKLLAERAVGNHSIQKHIEVPRTQDAPSLNLLTERVVGNNSLQKKIEVPRPQGVPSLKLLAGRAVGNKIPQKKTEVPRTQDVPSLKFLAERAVGNKNPQKKTGVPRTQDVPSLKFLAERAVANNSLQKTTRIPQTQDVPSLKLLAERAVGNNSLQKTTGVQQTQDVPSLKLLAERAVGNNSLQKTTGVPQTQDVPSLKLLAERAVGNNSLQKTTGVPQTQDVPSLKLLAERAVGNNSLQKTTGVPQTQDVPSLKLLAERDVGNNSLQKTTGVPQTQDVPSLKLLAERAVGNNSLQKTTGVPQTQDVPSLKLLAERAVGNNSLQKTTGVPQTQDVPSLKLLAERAVGNNKQQKSIGVPRNRDVSSLKFLAERGVGYNNIQKDIGVPRPQGIPSLKSLADRAAGNSSLQKNAVVPRVHELPSLKSLAETAVGDNSLQNIEIARTQDEVPSLKSLAEKLIRTKLLHKNTEEQRTQSVPSLKLLAQRPVGSNSLQKNIDKPKTQEVLSLKSLADVRTKSLQKNIEEPITRNVPSLKILVERAVDKDSLQKNTKVPKVQKCPNLNLLTENVAEKNSLQKNIKVPKTKNVPNLKFLVETAVGNNNLPEIIDVPRKQEVHSLKFLAEKSVRYNTSTKNIEVQRAQNVSSLKFLVERAVGKNSPQQNIEVPRTQDVSSLKFLAEIPVSNNNIQEDTVVPRKHEAQSLKFLAEEAIDRNRPMQNIELPVAQIVPSLKSLARKAFDNNSQQKSIVEPEAQESPSPKFLAEKAADNNSQLQNIMVSRAQDVPSLRLLTETAVDQTSRKQAIEVPRVLEVPSLSFLASKVVESSGLNQNMDESGIRTAENSKIIAIRNVNAGFRDLESIDVPELHLKILTQHSLSEYSFGRNNVPKTHGGNIERPVLCNKRNDVPTERHVKTSDSKRKISGCSTRRSRPPTRASGMPKVEGDGKEPESTDKTEAKSDWNYYSTERAQKKPAPDDINNNKKQFDIAAAFETDSQSADAREKNFCINEETKELNKCEPVDLDLYFKNYKKKSIIPTLRELAEMAVRKNQLLERSFDKPKISMVRTGSPEIDEYSNEVDIDCSPSINTERSRPLSSISSNRRTARSATLKSNWVKNDLSSNSPVSDEQKSGIKSAKNYNNDHEDKKTTGSCENEQHVKKKTPRLNKKKKIERVADKVDHSKLQRLKQDRDNISNCDVFSMINAIHEEDKEAAKMLDELKLITKLEKEQNNKITKSKAEEAQLVAEIGDFRDKLADTIEKKEKVDEKLLKIYKEELKPDTEYDVIEHYLHVEKMAKSYHEKRHFEECNIAYLEHELKTKVDQQNIKHHKTPTEPKIKPRMTRNAIRLQKEKGHKVRQDKINKTVNSFENGGRHNKDKHTGAKYFKALDDTNYKPLPPGMKEVQKSHKKTDQCKSGKEQKSTDTNIPIKNTATHSNKIISMNNNKTNISSTSRQQTRRKIPSKRDKDLEREQKDNITISNKKEVSETKRNNTLLMRNNNKNIDTNKQATKMTKVNGHTNNVKTELKYVTTKSVESVPKIENRKSRIAPKPNGMKPASSENTTEPVHRLKGGIKSNVQAVSAVVHANIDKSDNLKRNLNTRLLKRPTTVQPKIKPAYKNTQLPPLKHRKQTDESKQSKITGAPDDKRRVQLPKITNQKTKNCKDRHAKEISTVSKPDFVF